MLRVENLVLRNRHLKSFISVNDYRSLAQWIFRVYPSKAISQIAVRDNFGIEHVAQASPEQTESSRIYKISRFTIYLNVQNSTDLAKIQKSIAPLLKFAEVKLQELDLIGKRNRQSAVNEAELRLQAQKFKREKMQLRHFNRERLKLLARFSHDLKTPLSMLTLPLESIILSGEGISPKIRARLEKMKFALYSILHSLASALDLTASELSHFKSHRSIQNFSELLVSICSMYDIVFESYGMRLNVSVEPNIYFSLDPLQIEKVINNLLNNALKHNMPGQSVEVLLTCDANRRILLRITDNGLGTIASTGNLLKTTKSGVFASTGLGLGIVREIVKNHQGKFYFSSKPGVGSTVELHFSKAAKPSKKSLPKLGLYHTLHEVELLSSERSQLSRKHKI